MEPSPFAIEMKKDRCSFILYHNLTNECNYSGAEKAAENQCTITREISRFLDQIWWKKRLTYGKE